MVLLSRDQIAPADAQGLTVGRQVLDMRPGERRLRLQARERLDLLKVGLGLSRWGERLPGAILSLVLLRRLSGLRVTRRCRLSESPGQGLGLRRGRGPRLRMNQRLVSGLGLRMYLD